MTTIFQIHVSRYLFWLAVMLLPALAAAQEVRIGTFKTVRTKVWVQSNQTDKPVQSGDPVMLNQRIQTDKDGTASLVLTDGTTLVLGPNSSLDMARYQYDPVNNTGTMLVDLVSGSLRMITGWLGKLHPEDVKVRTPNAVTGVRGTDFLVEAP